MSWLMWLSTIPQESSVFIHLLLSDGEQRDVLVFCQTESRFAYYMWSAIFLLDKYLKSLFFLDCPFSPHLYSLNVLGTFPCLSKKAKFSHHLEKSLGALAEWHTHRQHDWICIVYWGNKAKKKQYVTTEWHLQVGHCELPYLWTVWHRDPEVIFYWWVN